MTRDPNEQGLAELLGAYVLDGLDQDEREQVERFLLSDSDARAELHALQLGAAWLAHAAPRPSDRVWAHISAEVERDLARDRAVVATRTLAQPRSRRRRLLTLAAAAAVAAGVVTFGITQVAGDERQPRSVALSEALHDFERSPDARFVDLLAPDGAGSARVVVVPDGHGFVISATLPDLDERQTYQLWALTGSGPVSSGLLGREPRVREFRFPRGTTALAITAEPAGGSRAPHGLPAAIAPLDSI